MRTPPAGRVERLFKDAARPPGQRPAPDEDHDNQDSQSILGRLAAALQSALCGAAGEAADLHQPTPAVRELDRTLCLKTRRDVRRDWTRGASRAPVPT